PPPTTHISTLSLHDALPILKDDLHPVMERIVMLHEIGHDALHREEAVKAGGFKEFNIFDMRQSRMEYEANIFASQISLPDDEILDRKSTRLNSSHVSISYAV